MLQRPERITSMGLQGGSSVGSSSSEAMSLNHAWRRSTRPRIAIFFRRDDVVGGTTGNVVDGRCQLTVLISSRTGTSSSPFDAPAMEAE